MNYIVKFSKSAAKAFEKLPNTTQKRIEQKLEYLKISPRGNDTKKLKGSTNYYRTRVGDYRIIFEIYDKELLVWIVDIDSRDDVYRK
ncbi:MAG TPA: type II toxin-antitoxin system RelE/ParE family toxin [Bacillota bacterium]|nr:type II toxin-antitoxin system RelE/ParE family toxin [Bacillota bacterium]